MNRDAQQVLAEHGIKIARTSPGNYTTTCPKCSAKRSREHQKTRCLSIKIERGDKVCWCCHHCGWSGPPKGSGKSGDDLTAYIYLDANGVVSFRKVRNKPGRDPRFWLQHPNGKGGWAKGAAGRNGILYRLPQVIEAIAAGQTVAVVEGERDADAVTRLGIVATTSANGASQPGKKPKWEVHHSRQLAGADLVILGDNDPPGYTHAEITARLSLGLAKRVRRLDLAPHWPGGMPPGADVSDWLAAGHSGDELRALIDSAPDYVPDIGESAKPEAASNGNGGDVDAEITRLAKLTTLQFEQERKGAAERLNVRASILDRLVQAERGKLGLDGDGDRQGHAITFPEIPAWSQPVDGAALLNDLAKAIRRHVVMSDTPRDEAALWCLHAFLFDRFLVSPRLGVTSPVKGCGKTTLLDVLSRLLPRPLPTANVTPAALFRVVERYRPALLVDEADTFLHDNNELRGVLNSGHRRGGQVLRTVGDDHEPRAFNTFCPTVTALIGHLPDTLHDRAVTIELKRALPTETVEPFRPDRANQLDMLARRAVRWAQDNAETIADADPKMPDGVINREADNWRPLLAIADVAGGEWPERARKAAQAAHIAAGGDDASRLELLLGDIRVIFTEQGKHEIPSADLVRGLVGLDGWPWAEYGRNGKPLTQNKLARLLKPLSIAPELVGKDRVSGYQHRHFEEAFERYLRPKRDSNLSTSPDADEMGTSEPSPTSHPGNGREVWKCEKPNNDGEKRAREVAKGEKGVVGLSRGTREQLASLARGHADQIRQGADVDLGAVEVFVRERVKAAVEDRDQVEPEVGMIMRLLFQ